MDKTQFEHALYELAETYPRANLGQKTIDIWYKRCNLKGYAIYDLALAIERLQDTQRTMPSLAELMKVCSEQQSRRLETDAYRLRENDKKEWQATMSDGTPVLKYTQKVLAALGGNEEAISELAWDKQGVKG